MRKVLQQLISKQWVIKQEEPELYYQVKDHLKVMQKFVQEKLGYTIIINPLMAKLEKLPGVAEPWMGIHEFQTIKEYQMLCYVLIYLEDKEIEQQFVLSAISEFIQAQFVDEKIEWTKFSTRKQLIRVLKFCLRIGIIQTTEGEEDRFAKDMHAEVLYENTGLSRFFLRNFFVDIHNLQNPEEFQEFKGFELEEDRGIVRRHRVYRRLLLSPGIYKENDNNDDFAYIRKYRIQIEKSFQELFPCDLHLHSSSAYLVMEDYKTSAYFPKTNAQDEIILCVISDLQSYIKQEAIPSDEIIHITRIQFLARLEATIERILKYLPKTYRDQGLKTLVGDTMFTMERYGFINVNDEEVKLFPIIGKVSGHYERNEENE